MDAVLADLIDRARRVTQTEGERQTQRIKFAYGNARIENADVTREMVRLASQRLTQHAAR